MRVEVFPFLDRSKEGDEGGKPPFAGDNHCPLWKKKEVKVALRTEECSDLLGDLRKV